MLFVSTRLAPDGRGGLGLFTTVDVPKGAKVWEQADKVDMEFTPEEFAALPESFQQKLRKHAYPTEQDGGRVACQYNGDDARFMNHSDTPAIVALPPPNPLGTMVASRDLDVGDELTCDYRTFDEYGLFCGSFLRKL